MNEIVLLLIQGAAGRFRRAPLHEYPHPLRTGDWNGISCVKVHKAASKVWTAGFL